MTRELEPGASTQALYGYELRRLRELTGKSAKEVADAGNCTSSLVYMLESGKRRPHMEFTKSVDELLAGDGLLTRIQEVIDREQPRYPSGSRATWTRQRATRLRIFEAQVIPGLLQTAAYARLLFGVNRPRDIEKRPIEVRVTNRMARQVILHREDPPEVWVAIPEHALRTALALPKRDAAERYEHLLTIAALPHVVLQVIPDRRGVHACMNGSFTLLTSPQGG
ncbi:helix-turn-helix transcriptional regulator [Embleya sp. NBC_00896]|uniref:helix-turn-helix domain-containing protein n=1 Tax=Embleya sp. NBC_00896 TaxID=2975961 RepID=UPI003863D0F4|nr:helix-turn-helix transcriptional regulator [Embleya sp. NBC_00896]